ncbi:MAG: FixH family protein [Planctomycetaceae bacterium]|nr:FixH family protein [Planctomycetaceae bacterium]
MFAALFPFEFAQPGWLWFTLAAVALIPLYRVSLVDLPRRQLMAATITRAAIVVLLVIALARPGYLNLTQDVFVVFAVDNSLSVGEAGRETADRFVQQATAGIDADRYRLLPFARTPRSSDQAGSGSDTAAATDETPWQSATNLQQAVDIAIAGMPPNRVPLVVLLSDGNETDGRVLQSLGEETRVSTVPLATRQTPEIQVSAVNAPAEVPLGEPFDVEVVIDANHDDQVQLDVFSGDFRIASERVDIAAGENRFLFPQQISRPTEFSALIRRPPAAGPQTFLDALADNNTASGVVFTAGQRRILMIDSQPASTRSLQRAMTKENMELVVRPASGMPQQLSELQNFDALVLSDVGADELSTAQMDMIRRYVGDLGGGFVMLGGNESFGLGGYYRTPVEEVLPVRCDFEKEKEKPGLGMVLVIDKSGSMGGRKLELAKEAARAAVALLGDKDQIGVIAFDGSPYWISSVVPATQKATVIDRIAGIRPGGGTTLYPALSEAYQALSATRARLKHIIILSDGNSTPADFDGLVRDMAADQITVSTVGIGDADRALLERMAASGNGRYYFTSDVSAIPQIFAKETIKASKSAINEEPFLPVQIRATRVLDGIAVDDAPFLLGYVVTRAKPTSEVILSSENGDPLLCWWRFGLGMSVAFTSDAQSRWAAEWLTWDGYSPFWAQVFRHCLRKQSQAGFEFQIEQQGPTRRLVIDAVGPTGQFVNQVETQLTIIDPALQTRTLLLEQSAPGRYETQLELSAKGAWQLKVAQSVDGVITSQQSRAVVVGYADELRLRPTNTRLLRQIARTSGGTFEPSPQSVFDPQKGRAAAEPIPAWPWCLMAAMLLLVLDVALRRLDLSRVFGSDVHREEYRSSVG